MPMTDTERRQAEAALELAYDKAGGKAALARALDIKRQSLQQWSVCPADRVADVEKATGVPRQALRPDVFR